MRLLRRITLGMSVAHSSPANTAVSLELRRFGMWSKPASSLDQQNCEGDMDQGPLSKLDAARDLGLEHLKRAELDIGAHWNQLRLRLLPKPAYWP
jgi:hypothetical protein